MLNSFLILVIYFVVQILAACAVILYQYFTLGKVTTEIDAHLLGTALLFLNLVLVAVLPLIGLVRKPKAWLGGAEKPKKKLQYGYGMELAAAGTVGLLLSLAGSSFLEYVGADDGGTTEMFRQMLPYPLCLIGLCLIGPLAEELVFREGIISNLVKSGRSYSVAAVASALLFALAHGNVMQGGVAFVMGMYLAWLYRRTGDLRLCLPVHIANNTLAVILLYFE